MAELAWLKREDEVFDGPGLIVEIDVLDPPAGDAIIGDNAQLIEVSNGSEHGDWTERSQSLFNPNSEIGMGSTADPAVPSGHPRRARARQRGGGWPDGTGRTSALGIRA